MSELIPVSGFNISFKADESFPSTYLTHEDVKDPGGDGQREGGEEDGEEPGGGVHGGVETLSLEMYMQLRELFLRGRDNMDSRHLLQFIEPLETV